MHYVHEVHKVHGVHDICSSFCHPPPMAIFTLAEINELMTGYKAALLAVRNGKSYRMSSGGIDREFTGQDITVIMDLLNQLDVDLQKLTI